MNNDKYNIPKTQANLRLKTIYNDPNFKRDAITFRDQLVELLITKGLLETPEHFTHCSRNVILRTLGNKVTARYDDFLQKCKISDDEYWAFLDLSAAPVFNAPITIDFTLGDTVKLEVHPWAKRKDLIAVWPIVEKALSNRKGYKKKLRGPDNLSLLYALMQARENGTPIPWETLAKQANTNTLEGYVHRPGSKKTWSDASLKEYYHRNKDFVGFM